MVPASWTVPPPTFVSVVPVFVWAIAVFSVSVSPASAPTLLFDASVIGPE